MTQKSGTSLVFSRHLTPRRRQRPNTSYHAFTSDCALFSRLFISCQTRNGDLDDFFRHEIKVAPFFVKRGHDPLAKEEVGIPTMPTVEVIIIDGTTFEEYASQSFLPYIKTQLQHADRVDVVWVVYVENSLKEATRCSRGVGVCCRISPDPDTSQLEQISLRWWKQDTAFQVSRRTFICL